MRSTNPVFSRSEQFSSPQQAPYPPYGAQQPYGAPGAPGAYGQQLPGQQPYGYGQQPWGQPQPQQAPPAAGVMTIDDVITKTAITMGVLFLSAALTFMFLPPQLIMPVALVSGLVAFVTVLFVALRRRLNPAGVLVYSVLEGVFIGAFSLMFELFWPGIVVQAVLATFVAAGATLAAYKFLAIRVTSQFRRIVTMSTFALLGLMLVNLVLALFGIDLGIRDIGGGPSLLSVIISIVAVVLAVANLIMDFDYIEQGVRNRLPASESWRAAFGLTVTMVWLYTELLRIMSYFRSN